MTNEHECPKCGSTDLDYGVMEIVDEQVYYPYECLTCGATGNKWFALKYVETTLDIKENDSSELNMGLSGRKV